MPLELTAWAHVADVARMPDPLARRIANFLASARELDASRRGYLAQQLAFEASQYVSPLPAGRPRAVPRRRHRRPSRPRGPGPAARGRATAPALEPVLRG